MAIMVRRKVCKNCGFINKDGENCYECDSDLNVYGFSLEIDLKEKRKYYDYKLKIFSDVSPFALEKQSFQEEKIEEFSKITPERGTKSESIKNNKEDLFKICPDCGIVVSSEVEDCPQCGRSLSFIKPFKNEEIRKQREKEEQVQISPEISEEEHTYLLVIGVNGKNEIPLDFSNGPIEIGRKHQECLENQDEVSRHHCCIEQKGEDEFYLYEEKDAPSTNHTYIQMYGGRLEQLIPGKKYPIRIGTVFYITKKISALIRKK